MGIEELIGRKAVKSRSRVLIQCLHSKPLYGVSKFSMMEISVQKVLELFEKWQRKLNKY